MRMEIISRLLLALILNILWTMIGYAAPLLDTKDTWSENVFAPGIKTACSSDGQCWEWLPMSEMYDSTVVIPEQDSDTVRLQSRRQIAHPISDLTLRSWKDSTLEEAKRGIRPPLPINKQTPTRTTKKDVFVSRGWGAGGMPFSVLYMNPHGSRSNHGVTASSTSQRQESSTTTETSTSFVEQSNSRITPRNGQPTVQPRRQYWTIPQLFISYGWGHFGK